MATRYGSGHIFTSNTKDAILINVWFSQKSALNQLHFYRLQNATCTSVSKGMPVPLSTEGNLFNFGRSIAFGNIEHFCGCDVILGY